MAWSRTGRRGAVGTLLTATGWRVRALDPSGPALGRRPPRGHRPRGPGPVEELADPCRRQLRGCGPRQSVLPVRRDRAAPRCDRRVFRELILRGEADDSLPDGGLCADRERRCLVSPAGVWDAVARRRSRFEPLLPVRRRAGTARCRQRLRSWPVLSGVGRQPRADRRYSSNPHGGSVLVRRRGLRGRRDASTSRLEPVLQLDRGARAARSGNGLRRRSLLSDRGGLPGPDRAPSSP